MSTVVYKCCKRGRPEENLGCFVRIPIAKVKRKMEPKTVEEDLKEVSEDELLANWKDHKWNWLWYVAVFLVFIVIFYYMF